MDTIETDIESTTATASSGAGLRLGELLIAEGLLTPAQLEQALRLQAHSATYQPIGHILIAQKVITRRQLLSALARYRRRSKLGDLLVKTRVISPEQLQTALARQQRTGRALGETLIQLQYLTEEQLRRALCLQLHIKFFELDAVRMDPTLRAMVNQRFAMRHRLVPLAQSGNTLVVAMDDPTMTGVIDELERSSGHQIEVVTSSSDAIARALARLYSDGEPEPPTGAEVDVDVVSDEPPPILTRVGLLGAAARSENADHLVRQLLRIAIDRGASDIHLETVDRRLRVRFRVDGMLQYADLGSVEMALDRQRAEVISRIKILSKLDIAERRRPQDGSFRARVEQEGRVAAMDFRVSIIPGRFGENVVIRILDPRSAPDGLDALRLAEPVAARLRQLIRSSTGMILVTGPTGSGKSTTLFGVLKSVARPEIKILTAEDPIEYVCDRFSQHEVNERIGNTFAQYVRSFMRHDPEVIMIGEIRDRETAELALRAAQTGHLVLSTLHTNDALGAVPRLLDLGVEASICTASLLGVLAQRLVREVCWNCKEEYAPSTTLLREVFDVPPAPFRWYRGRGCAACQETGYKGRMVITELWTPSDDDVMLINRGASLDELIRSAEKSTLSMAEDALTKLREGRTTIEELIRALPHSALRKLSLAVI